MGPRNTTEGHAAASTYNWSQERPGGPAGLEDGELLSHSWQTDKTAALIYLYCNTAWSAGFYLNSNQEDNKMCLYIHVKSS